jgi:hypothetical protein
MSAPDSAIPFRNEPCEEDPEFMSPIYRDPVECSCGWSGEMGDLLCDPDDPGEQVNNFWCPVCRTRGWVFS